MITATELFSARRILIAALGRIKANHLIRATIASERNFRAGLFPYETKAIRETARRSYRTMKHNCVGGFMGGAWFCQCGADSPRECQRAKP